MKLIEEFFVEIDQKWKGTDSNKIILPIIGSAALMLQSNYSRGTKDSDILETAEISGTIEKRLLELAGRGTNLHKKYRCYIDIVKQGLPFLPQKPFFHSLSLKSLQHFKIITLDLADVIVSKLKRFNANDAHDIQAMIELKAISHKRLVERFNSAVDVYSMDARAEDLPTYLKNLHTVERDWLRVPESRIDLPDWI